MECRDRDGSHDLKVEVARLNVHEWTLRSVSTNAIEYFPEESFKLFTPGGTVRKLARIEDRCTIGKRGAEVVPIEVVECLDEV